MSRLTQWFLAVLVLVPICASATTMERRGLDALVANSSVILRGQVIDTHSYWNANHTQILTDTRLQVIEKLKGNPTSEVTVTTLGGQVGETSVLIVDGPVLVDGNRYLLFLQEAQFRGLGQRLTVVDLTQGVFDHVDGRLVSQAAHEALIPDRAGQTEAPGGPDGLPVDDMIRDINHLIRP